MREMMTDQQVLEEVASNSKHNKLRRAFTGEAAAIDQAMHQRAKPSMIEVRRMERVESATS